MLDAVTPESQLQFIKDTIPTVETPQQFKVLKESIQTLVESSLDTQEGNKLLLELENTAYDNGAIGIYAMTKK